MKRKYVSMLLCMSMATSMMTGMTVTAETEPSDLEGTVVIWDWDSTSQNKYVEKFNEVYPNVTVDVQDVSWDDYMTKLQTSYVSGMDLPDIILGEIAWRGTLFDLSLIHI